MSPQESAQRLEALHHVECQQVGGRVVRRQHHHREILATAIDDLLNDLAVTDGTPEQHRWFNELERTSASPEMAVRLLYVLGGIDVTELLPQVAVPTLVLHSREDARVPFEHGLMLARTIPGARLVALESKNHLILSHEPAWSRYISELSEFLQLEESEQVMTTPV